jgi:peptide-methionine (R)-S-oxide reductase
VSDEVSEDLKRKPDSYWRERLTPEQYHVLREKGTEPPRVREAVGVGTNGVYCCAACGQELFTSDTKFESTLPGLTGWPAFYAEAAEGRVELKDDDSFGMHRTEITCARCGSHLGHLFGGDPAAKGGKHYCVNSCALNFERDAAG